MRKNFKKSVALTKTTITMEMIKGKLNFFADTLHEIQKIFWSYCNNADEQAKITEGIKEILDKVLKENLEKSKAELVLLKLKSELLEHKLHQLQEMIELGNIPDFNSFKARCEKELKEIKIKKNNWACDKKVKEDILITEGVFEISTDKLLDCSQPDENSQLLLSKEKSEVAKAIENSYELT